MSSSCVDEEAGLGLPKAEVGGLMRGCPGIGEIERARH